MLIEFKYRNYKSFFEEQTFSMIASKDKSLSDNTIETTGLGRNNLLRSSVLYGANASGKSNFIDAIRFVKQFVESSADRSRDHQIPIKPFVLSKELSKIPSKFEVSFIFQSIRYQYGFSVDRTRVFEEWLIAYPKGKPQTWFERNPTENNNKNESDWYFGPNLKGAKTQLLEFIRPDVLFLSLAALFNHKQLTPVYDWFDYFLRFLSGDSLIPYFTRFSAEKIYGEIETQKKIASFLDLFDIGIKGLEIEKRKPSEDDYPDDIPETVKEYLKSEDLWDINLIHKSLDDNENSIALPFEEESLGTQKLFSMSVPWFLSLVEGYTLVIDELDSSLHPNLVRGLLNFFHNPKINTGNGQLIFNTHDTSLLDANIFRRDQIWFVEKDNQGKSHIYPLLDFSPRKDENLERGYLQGRYGGIPFLKGSLEGFLSNGET